MFLVDALGMSGIRHVSAIHEQGAGAMAIGYSQLTHKLGVVLVTSGPGVTNATTPCFAAWTDSVPVLFISGQARTPTLVGTTGLRTRGIQECDTVSLAEPITKFAFEVYGLLDKKFGWLDRIIEMCMEGRRGPCWLSVPQDVQGMEV